jgi:hypothetical protein
MELKKKYPQIPVNVYDATRLLGISEGCLYNSEVVKRLKIVWVAL